MSLFTVQHHPLLALGLAAHVHLLQAPWQHAILGILQQLAEVLHKVAHALCLASCLPVLELDQLTDVLDLENELQVKALGKELAAELGLRVPWTEKYSLLIHDQFCSPRPFLIDLGPVLFLGKKYLLPDLDLLLIDF